MPIYKYTYKHTYKHTYRHTYKHTYTHIQAHMHTYKHTHAAIRKNGREGLVFPVVGQVGHLSRHSKNISGTHISVGIATDTIMLLAHNKQLL